MHDVKIVDWGEGITVVPIPQGVGQPIIGKISGKMFGIDYKGTRTLYYLPESC